MSRMVKSVGVCALALGAALAMGTAAQAAVSVGYTGQGTMSTPDGRVLESEQCDESGDGYLLWVFTATKGTSATISGPWGTAEMTQSGGGTFKFTSDFYDVDALVGTVSAWSDQTGGNPQLVISHGCEDDDYPSSETPDDPYNPYD